MNGKKAKQLRAHARKLTVGEPAVAYMPITSTTKSFVSPVTKKKGFYQVPDTIRLADCTRSVYKDLKKFVKSRAQA